MICNLCVGILWQIMEKLYVHFSLPLGGIEAEIALFVTIVTHVVMNVIIWWFDDLYHHNYSSYHLSRNRATPNFFLYLSGTIVTQVVNNVSNKK